MRAPPPSPPISAMRTSTRTGERRERLEGTAASERDERLGFVGDVGTVDPSIVQRLIREELIPIIATVGVDEAGQPYNVNADTVAGAIAESLRAEKLVYLTNVTGLYGDVADEASLISRIDVDRLAALVDDGRLSEGMIPKARSCV